METESEQRLKKLQVEKERLIFKMEKRVSYKQRKENHERLIEIDYEMAKVNKLDAEEKNIHVIWIGIPDENEFDNLKVWAKYNPSYQIHIWTDSTHVLVNYLNNILFNNCKTINNGIKEHDHQFEADLKDEFYNNYQLKNPDKTFDENAKNFLIDLQYTNKNTILNWIKEGKKQLIQEQKNIKKYTPNQVILHDVNQEKNNIFPNKEYYNGYLKTLEHLHLAAGASDRLRYAILNNFGGVYLDTDISMKFNLEDITNEKMAELISSVKRVKIHDKEKIIERDLILNQMILLEQTNQLNMENLKKFAQKWEKGFGEKSDTNFKIFEKIAKEFKNNNSKLKPNMLLNEFPINNVYPTTCYHVRREGNSNAFIVSKKNSKILQDAMKNIEIVEENIKNMNTFKKLINKDSMILYHTGPINLQYSILENNKVFCSESNKNYATEIMTLETFNTYFSSWYDMNDHKDTIRDVELVKTLFLGTEITKNEKMKKLNSEVKKDKSELELEL